MEITNHGKLTTVLHFSSPGISFSKLYKTIYYAREIILILCQLNEVM